MPNLNVSAFSSTSKITLSSYYFHLRNSDLILCKNSVSQQSGKYLLVWNSFVLKQLLV